MARKSARAWFIVPILALVFAFACAPAAFATEVQDLQAVNLQSENLYGNIGKRVEDVQVVFTDSTTQTYSGVEIEPKFKTYLDEKEIVGTDNFDSENTPFYYYYMGNVDVSTSQADPELKPQLVLCTFVEGDPWVYTKVVPFEIVAAEIDNASAKATNEVYTGKKVIPETVVTYNGTTLQGGKDYDVRYVQKVKKKTKKSKAKTVYKKVTPKKVGTYYVEITGKGNFTGKKYAKFKITKASIKNAKFSNVKDRVYTGDAFTPNVKVKFNGKKLKKGRDYKIKYSNNRNAGVATITIKGKGNLKGTQKIKFAIAPRPIGDADATFNHIQPYANQRYVEPDPKLKFNGRSLTMDYDYTADYRNNRKIGTQAKIHVHGKGNFTGSATITFTIDQIPIYNASISVSDVKSPTATPSVSVSYDGRQLRKGTDYSVFVDTAKRVVTITGTGVGFIYSTTKNYNVVK